MNFDQAFDRLLGNEGAYSFNPADPGGETMWGVTSRVARANGYYGDMKTLPRATAAAIYKAKFWDMIQADALPALVRFEVFDAAVNSGPAQAVKWLQRAVDVDDDGNIGPATLAAAGRAVPLRTVLAINGLRLRFMTSQPTWGAFGRGWANRIADNLVACAIEKEDS